MARVLTETDPGDEQLPTESERAQMWQEEQMIRLGMGGREAARLAAEGVSWHAVEDLVFRGCSIDSVYRILL